MNALEQSRLSAHTSGVFKNENSEHDLLCGYLQSWDLFSLTKAHRDCMGGQTSGKFKKAIFNS